jgi:hypothetical protein
MARRTWHQAWVELTRIREIAISRDELALTARVDALELDLFQRASGPSKGEFAGPDVERDLDELFEAVAPYWEISDHREEEGR